MSCRCFGVAQIGVGGLVDAQPGLARQRQIHLAVRGDRDELQLVDDVLALGRIAQLRPILRPARLVVATRGRPVADRGVGITLGDRRRRSAGRLVLGNGIAPRPQLARDRCGRACEDAIGERGGIGHGLCRHGIDRRGRLNSRGLGDSGGRKQGGGERAQRATDGRTDHKSTSNCWGGCPLPGDCHPQIRRLRGQPSWGPS